MKTYTLTETAKLIREVLHVAFPKTAFSVRSKSYAGGCSIDVSWTDGPTTRQLDPLINPFAGSGFDGMEDMKYSKPPSSFKGEECEFGVDYVFGQQARLFQSFDGGSQSRFEGMRFASAQGRATSKSLVLSCRRRQHPSALHLFARHRPVRPNGKGRRRVALQSRRSGSASDLKRATGHATPPSCINCETHFASRNEALMNCIDCGRPLTLSYDTQQCHECEATERERELDVLDGLVGMAPEDYR